MKEKGLSACAFDRQCFGERLIGKHLSFGIHDS